MRQDHRKTLTPPEGRKTVPILVATLIVFLVFAALVGPRGVDSTSLLRDVLAHGCTGWGFQVLLQLRLPRVVIAACTGATLSMAGICLQTWLRNPIAEPGILGISTWGSLGAVLALYLGANSATPWAQPIMAGVGALCALSVLLVAAHRGQSPERLLMLGVGLGGIGASLVSLVLSWSLPDWKASRQIIGWLLGGLDGRTWVHATAVVPLAAFGMGLLLAEHRALDALRLGALEAASLGIDVRRLEWRIVVSTGLLAGAAAAGAGAIGFVGIFVPYWVRGNGSLRHGCWLIRAGLLGALFLLVADLVARRAPGSSEIQLGVLTGLLGAPVLLRRLLTQQTEVVG